MAWFRRRTAGAPGSSGSGSSGSSEPELAERNPGLLEQLYVNARLLSQKADLQYRNLDLNRALDTQAQAVASWERVVAEDPASIIAGRDLGAAYNRYAVLLAGLGRIPDAVDQANLALDVLGPLSADDPQAVLPVIAGTLANIIVLLDDSGRHGDADLARQDRAMVASVLANLG